MDLTFFTIVCGAAAVFAVTSQRARALSATRAESDPSLPDERGSQAQWDELAERYTLTLVTGAESATRHPDDRKVIGQLHGFPIELAVERDSTRALRCWGRVRFRPALGLALDVDQVRRFFDSDAFPSGDARFDSAFIVRSRARELASCFLTSTVRLRLLDLSAVADRVALTDDGLWWSRRRPDMWGHGARGVSIQRELMLVDELAQAFRDAVQRVELQLASDAERRPGGPP